LTLPGILHIVGIGKVPVPIEDHEIAAMQAIVQSGLVVEPWPFLEVGQWVRLEAGPLARFQGILIGTAKDQRVVASLSLLKKSVAVSVEHHWVTPLDGGKRELLDLPQT
jgi:transcription antitermination factor NusG